MIDSPQAQIGRIKALQEDLVHLQGKIRGQIGELGKYLDEVFTLNWDQTFPGTKPEFITGVDGGSMTNRWEPEVYLYAIDDIRPAENGKWYEGSIERPPPVMLSRLQEFTLAFLRITQIPVKIAYTTPPKPDEDW